VIAQVVWLTRGHAHRPGFEPRSRTKKPPSLCSLAVAVCARRLGNGVHAGPSNGVAGSVSLAPSGAWARVWGVFWAGYLESPSCNAVGAVLPYRSSFLYCVLIWRLRVHII
jgi:hypothetical protein